MSKDIGNTLRDKIAEIADPKHRQRIKTLCSLMSLKYDMENERFVTQFINEARFPRDSIFELKKDDITDILRALRDEAIANLEGTIGVLEDLLKED